MNKRLSALKRNGMLRWLLTKILFALNHLRYFNFLKGFNNKINFHASTLLFNVRWTFKGTGNVVQSHENVVLKNLFIEINGSNNRVFFGKNTRIYESGKFLIEGDNCEIFIGNHSTIGSASLFCTETNTSIYIGEDCMLGREIRILTGDFHSIIDLDTNIRINPSSNVVIGNHVWLGYHSSVSKGAKISDNTIVGSYSMVNKEFVEENIILAGSPAKIIRRNTNWDRRKLPISED